MNENTIKVLNREGKVNEGKVLLFCKDKETERKGYYLCGSKRQTVCEP